MAWVGKKVLALRRLESNTAALHTGSRLISLKRFVTPNSLRFPSITRQQTFH